MRIDGTISCTGIVLDGNTASPSLASFAAFLDADLRLGDIDRSPGALAVLELELKERTDLEGSLHLAIDTVVALFGGEPTLGDA